ncbi:hypothetical protein ACFLYU_01385 [Candidatus Dependentiae bacterium]
MKNLMNRKRMKSFSFLVLFSIIFSFSTSYSGPFWGLFGRKKVQPKTTLLGKLFYGTGTVAFLGVVFMAFTKLFGGGDCNLDATDKPDVTEREGQEVEIPEYIAPYVIDSVRLRGINYLQLETVNQFSNTIIGSKLVKNLIAKRQEYSKAKEGETQQERKERIESGRGFSSSATCPSHAIRNAFLACQLFSPQRNDFQRQMFLDMFKSEDHVRSYLERLVNDGLPISWLLKEVVVDRINQLGISDNVSVLESVASEIDGGYLNAVVNKFRNNDSCFHVFIINTGDMTGGLWQARVAVEQELNVDIDQESFNSLLDREQRKAHWYAAVLRKDGDRYSYYILDTIREDNHITDPAFSDRNIYLIENIIQHNSSNPKNLKQNNFSNINFYESIEKYGKRCLRNDIRDGFLWSKKRKKIKTVTSNSSTKSKITKKTKTITRKKKKLKQKLKKKKVV